SEINGAKDQKHSEGGIDKRKVAGALRRGSQSASSPHRASTGAFGVGFSCFRLQRGSLSVDRWFRGFRQYCAWNGAGERNQDRTPRLFSSFIRNFLFGPDAVSRVPELWRRIQSHGTRPLRRAELSRAAARSRSHPGRRHLPVEPEIFSAPYRQRFLHVAGLRTRHRRSLSAFTCRSSGTAAKPRRAGRTKTQGPRAFGAGDLRESIFRFAPSPA